MNLFLLGWITLCVEACPGGVKAHAESVFYWFGLLAAMLNVRARAPRFGRMPTLMLRQPVEKICDRAHRSM